MYVAALCLRYVDTVAIGAWFVPSWCAQKKRSRLKKNKTNEQKKKQKEKVYVIGIDPDKITSPSANTG